MTLTKPEQAEMATYTLMFLILFGLFRPMVLNKQMNGNWAIIMTICFFVWYIMS